MTRKAHPEFHKALLEPNLYPSANRRIKYEETPHSHLYKTGQALYKIRKTNPVYSSLAIKEAFAHEAARLTSLWGLEAEVVPIIKEDGTYRLGGAGEAVDYALRMPQLAGHYWMHELLAQGKLNPTAIGRLARLLATQHEAHALDEAQAEGGRPEALQALFEEVAYQVKKYFGQTITEPMYDLIWRPVEHFLGDARKLLMRRQKRGRIVSGHGAFVPEHIYLKGKDALAVSPLEAHPKYRRLDAANDVATLLNGLTRLGDEEAGDLFLKRYVATNHDRELARVLPYYRTFQALRSGLVHCERMVELPAEHDAEARLAHEAFNLAVRYAREIARDA